MFLPDALRLVLVVGQPRTGKTTLAYQRLRAVTPRLLTLDPYRTAALTTQVEHTDARPFSTWAALSAFLASDKAGGRWSVLLRSLNESDYWHALRAARCYRFTSVLADEALFYLSDRHMSRALVRFSRTNAHYGDGLGVPLWLTAQRPIDVPPDIRSAATGFVSFRQEEPADLGFLAERCSPSFAETVAGLGPHRWVAYPPSLMEEGNERFDAAPLGGRRSRVAPGALPDGASDERHRQAPPAREVGAHGEQVAMEP